jgi:Raf kinase inhibitor-like YbhB/YbcL family protein
MRLTRILATTATVALALAGLSVGLAQNGGGGKKGGRGGGIPAPLKISIAAFTDGGVIPAQYGCAAGKNANLSPAIQWSGAPAGTETIALILHDPDVSIGAEDVLHWAIYNIPATATGLPEGVPPQATLPDGSVQIKNIGGSIGFFNPCPPPPTTHHYMFEFYALDQKLDPGLATRADLLAAMTGHIRAKGVYFGLFHQ